MKKKLLFMVFAALAITTTTTNAQTKVWDFGNDAVTWPLTPTSGTVTGTIGPDTEAVIDLLGLYSNNPAAENDINNFGAVNSNNTTFPDGYQAARRFQMNGAGYPSGPFQAMPTQRYLFVDVTGACTIKVWFRPGSANAARTIYVSNGTIAVGQATSATSGGDQTIVTAAAPAAGRYYIYGDTACNLYKVEVVGASVNTTLSVNDFDQIATKVHSFKNQVFVSNVLTATEVKVYNVLGALVKSFTTSSDTDFQLNQTGVFIVNVKSDEGEKSVKVLLN